MLYDKTGSRKYLTSKERRAFIGAALLTRDDISTFGLTLAYTGARISEVLALTPQRIDFSLQGIVIRTLKRRRQDIFRIIPVPADLLERLERVHNISARQRNFEARDQPIWTWCRTSAWSKIKAIMSSAGIIGACAMPKGLRHGLGVEGTADSRVPLNVMQKWLGHARIETTAIYANALGAEERALAERTWPIPIAPTERRPV